MTFTPRVTIEIDSGGIKLMTGIRLSIGFLEVPRFA
jgi:hypothetical protein